MDAENRSADAAASTPTMPPRPATDARDVIITRVVDAPRELVFDAWTNPAHVAKWWRPKGFETVVCEEMDVRVGGTFRFRMTLADGTVYMSRNIYREIEKPVRIVYDEACDKAGKPFHHARMTVTFDDDGTRTAITIRARFEWLEGRDPQWTPEAMKQGLAKGWNDNLDLLEPYLDAIEAASDESVRSRP